MKKKAMVLVALLYATIGFAQIPVEVLGGHQKTTFDLMFFKYFKGKEDKNSPFLFFNRNRASLDYRQTSTAYLPQFSFTEALSYNNAIFKGFAPVAVVQISNKNIFPKAGIQYFHAMKNFIFFSWVVSEFVQNPLVDFFVITRFTPQLKGNLQLYTQIELVNAFPTEANGLYTFYQRARLGLKVKEWQWGLGSDFNQIGNTNFLNSANLGLFLRHEF